MTPISIALDVKKYERPLCSPSKESLTVSVVSTREEIEERTSQWLALLERGATGGNVHNDPRMIVAMLSAHTELEPRIVFVWAGDALVAVAPFYRQPTQFTLDFSIRRLATWRTMALRLFGESVVLDSDANVDECVAKLCETLEHVAFSADYFWVYDIDVSDRFWNSVVCTPGIHSQRGLRCIITQRSIHHQVELKSSFDEYASSISSGNRQTLRRRRRRCLEIGSSRIQKFRSTDDVTSLLQHMDEVANASWQQKALGGKSRSNDSRDELLRAIAAMGWLCSYVLFLDGKPVAFQHGYLYRSTYMGMGCAYNQEFSEYSPGSVLTWCVLEDLHASESVEKMDFGFGDSPYKQILGNIQLESFVAFFVPRNRWRYLLRLQQALNHCERIGRAALVKLKLDRVIRNLLKHKK